MKNIFYSIIVLMLSATVFAQAPQSFKYQAVVRDGSGEIIADQTVGVQISILQGSASSTAVYTETHADSTNQFGLVTLEIGTGTTTDDFTGIDWSNNAYFIQIEMDVTGGTSYTLMGTSQLLSVPYAIYADSAGNTFSGSYNDLTNTPDLGDYLTAEVDGDITNELQVLSISNDTLYLTGGGKIYLGNYSDTLSFDNGTLEVNNAIINSPNFIVGNETDTINSGLIAYYPFNGNANDLSGNEHNGIVNGATLTTDRFGNPNSAYYFDGNDYIKASIGSYEKLAISLWFNVPEAVIDYPNLFDYGDVEFCCHFGGDNIGYEGEYGWVYAIIKSEGISIPSLFQPEYNQWHHLYVVYDNDSANFAMYIDGVFINKLSTTNVLSPSNDTIYIGSKPPDYIYYNKSFLTGKIDNIKIYSRSLSNDEILTLSSSQPAFEIRNSDIFINDQTKGIILKSPDGNCWRVTVNNDGSFHSNQINCPDSEGSSSVGTVTDYDGNSYNTVKIGNQWWMTENLKAKHYANGDAIPDGTGVGDISGETNPKYWFAYDDNLNNVSTYGRLYTWYTITDSRNVCPDGWHVPSDAEWTELTDYLGGASVAGGKLKETGTTHWNSPNTGATNESGFTALPGGFYHYDGYYDNIGYYVNFWSATEAGSCCAWYRGLYYDTSGIYPYGPDKKFGYSVRCIKNE